MLFYQKIGIKWVENQTNVYKWVLEPFSVKTNWEIYGYTFVNFGYANASLST